MNSLKVVFLLLAVAAFSSAEKKNVFLGEISDSQCAMNVHSLSRSHQEMIEKSTMGTDAASCAKACIRRGGEWVLRDGDNVYRLKNQADVDLYAGQKVKISGVLDPKTNTIDNTHIEVFPAPRHSQPAKVDSVLVVH
ncbi:MAG TPA: hypothetical protein VJO35_03575 [Terriglobales bacterium]|nr:hypothetical protein [Terriglobales bacterium]